MNERIQEINLDAIREVFDGPDPDGDIERMYIPDEYVRVFAELIVRECSRYIEDKFDFCGDEIIIAESVLKHFGVEE